MSRICACDRRRSTYWPPRHILDATTCPELLGDREQFCSAFFHVLACTELGITEHVCLNTNPRECRHQCVTLVARLDSAAPATNAAPLKIKRYTTCRARNGTPVHAENFLVSDADLLAGIEGDAPISDAPVCDAPVCNAPVCDAPVCDAPATLKGLAHLTIYAQLQPCHHSAGTDADVDDWSCTELIIRWYEEMLKPRGVVLTIRCANLYKAMWEFGPDEILKPPETRYLTSVGNARVGLALLYAAGIRVAPVEDWTFLASLTTFSDTSQTEAAFIRPDQAAARADADKKIADYLTQFVAPPSET